MFGTGTRVPPGLVDESFAEGFLSAGDSSIKLGVGDPPIEDTHGAGSLLAALPFVPCGTDPCRLECK